MESRPPRPQPAALEGQVAALDLQIAGAVQGVGFRPFVYGLAVELGLSGEVRNTVAGVEVHIEGPVEDLGRFVARVGDEAPPLAFVEDLSSSESAVSGTQGFRITSSDVAGRVDTLVTADAATCDACLAEVFDPGDRRYRYPFTNCTDCGPRFTITRAVPYDRPQTTMAPFRMCPECEREYHDPSDRRFHAQPNACPVCGPKLAFVPRPGCVDIPQDEAALRQAVALLRAGGVLALKGLGGYHLACDATDEHAVEVLRGRKHRDEKPFAVMVGSADEARGYCHLSSAEEALLTAARRPVVLLDRRPGGASLAPGVAPGVTTYGLLLPYTPLHHLLHRDMGRPLVMTSGNLSDEPIAFEDADAVLRLSGVADGFLTHDRGIHMRTDDSVARTFRSQPYVVRRARGYAPLPVSFSGCDSQILAVGGHLKNTFCLTRGTRAFMSHHIGDLENLETLRSARDGIAHFRALFDLEPDLVAHDLHPGYLSTGLARELADGMGLPTVAVQHHEAHVASVLADTRFDGRVVGVAFDGAGLGTDGTVWGGEFFVGAPGAFERAAHLGHLRLPGGDAAAREPWRLALSMLDRIRQADADDADAELWMRHALARLPHGQTLLQERPWAVVLQAARQGVNSPETSSAGRLFDAVSALVGLRHVAAYEGQAAIYLETHARRRPPAAGDLSPGDTPLWAAAAVVPAGLAVTRGVAPPTSLPVPLPVEPFGRAVLADLDAGVDTALIAARFHQALAVLTADTAIVLADRAGVEAVALGGGVFQNLLFLELVAARLERAGLRVLYHRAVPTNDGGLSLGQAEVAAALVRRGSATVL